jgi:hypothetical protein
MLIKVSTWSCLEIRMQDQVTTQIGRKWQMSDM